MGSSFDDYCAFLPASQPVDVSTEDRKAVNEVSKLSIAHEIIVNQDFVVKEDDFSESR